MTRRPLRASTPAPSTRGRGQRAVNPKNPGPRVTGDMLLTACWCGESVRKIPRDVMRGGDTWCCGLPLCLERHAAHVREGDRG